MKSSKSYIKSKSNCKIGNQHKHFTEQNIHLESKHMKRYLTSLAIRKVQIKTTVGQHCTSICMSTIKAVKIPNASMDVEEIDDLYIVDRNLKWEILSGKHK